MRYLACVLACEGNSDRAFFPELLKRALEELCAEHVPSAITVLPIRVLDAEVQRPESVLAAVHEEEGTFDLVFFHRSPIPRNCWRSCWAVPVAGDAVKPSKSVSCVSPRRFLSPLSKSCRLSGSGGRPRERHWTTSGSVMDSRPSGDGTPPVRCPVQRWIRFLEGGTAA